MQFILNVDDYHPSRYARTKVLQQAGFEVIEASTGQAALELIHEKKPVLVLLDVNLPDISGFEVCRRIKTDPKIKATPVLHISASSVQTAHQVHGLDAGADSYLVEPIDAGILIATVKAFLRAREAEDALRRSNEELEWFVYRVAHDLNEPLRTITAHTQLLERKLVDVLQPDSAELVGFNTNATQRMGTFIDNLLRYSQISHGEQKLVTLDTNETLSRVLVTLDGAIASSGANITFDQLPIIEADPALEYVFQNLISNAIKYSREQVVPEIHISARRDGGTWVFSITDNGIGIDTKDQSQIFKVFHRLHGNNVPGNGIGLALAQKIIGALGGNLWVESTLGAGSQFFFTIPFNPSKN